MRFHLEWDLGDCNCWFVVHWALYCHRMEKMTYFLWVLISWWICAVAGVSSVQLVLASVVVVGGGDGSAIDDVGSEFWAAAGAIIWKCCLLLLLSSTGTRRSLSLKIPCFRDFTVAWNATNMGSSGLCFVLSSAVDLGGAVVGALFTVLLESATCNASFISYFFIFLVIRGPTPYNRLREMVEEEISS